MKTEVFRAQSETGKIYVITKVTEQINTGGLDGPGSINGLSQYRTSQGELIRKIGDGVFLVPSTGDVLRRMR